MSITSPLSILFWIGFYGFVMAKTATATGTADLLIYSSMTFLGLTCKGVFVAMLAISFRCFLNEKSLKTISIVSALSLLGLGGYFDFQGFTALLAPFLK